MKHYITAKYIEIIVMSFGLFLNLFPGLFFLICPTFQRGQGGLSNEYRAPELAEVQAQVQETTVLCSSNQKIGPDAQGASRCSTQSGVR